MVLDVCLERALVSIDALHPTTAGLARRGDRLLANVQGEPRLVEIDKITTIQLEAIEFLRFEVVWWPDDDMLPSRDSIDLTPEQPIVISGYWSTQESQRDQVPGPEKEKEPHGRQVVVGESR